MKIKLDELMDLSNEDGKKLIGKTIGGIHLKKAGKYVKEQCLTLLFTDNSELEIIGSPVFSSSEKRVQLEGMRKKMKLISRRWGSLVRKESGRSGHDESKPKQNKKE